MGILSAKGNYGNDSIRKNGRGGGIIWMYER